MIMNNYKWLWYW